MYRIDYKTKILILALAGSSLCGMLSCSKESVESLDAYALGLDYYPVSIGKVWVYQMDSTWYRLNNQVVKQQSFGYLREEVVDTFRDVTGKLIHRLDVFQTRDTTLGWDLTDSYFIEANDRLLQKRESGLSYVRLVFPPQDGKSWNGNINIHPKTQIQVQGELLEPFDQWLYYYEYIDRPETIGNKPYQHVCKVMEVDDENIIQKRYSMAKYARGVGMVYKELVLLETQNTDTSIPFEQRAEKGLLLKLSLIRYE